MNSCASCGRENAAQASFCQFCGNALPIGSTSSAGPLRLQAGTYAGFWVRAGAAVLDFLLLIVAARLLSFLAGAGFLFGLAIPWLYEAFMLSSEIQATLGKRALGIVVTDSAGNRLTFARATGRHFAKYLSSLLFGIGFLMAAFTGKKQALHDLLADTVVVIAKSDPELGP